MAEFWETSFREKQEMWGFEPADSAIATVELFKSQGINKILIPGFGYGRNAGIFVDNGCKVTGIEISQTAIDLAKKHFGDKVKLHHAPVNSMPLDNELYDGIFCYALIHLLSAEERVKLISDCYNQLRPDGYMVFVAISKMDAKYGEGKEIGKDTFESKHGVNLYFYDADSIMDEFGKFGMIEAVEIEEPIKYMENQIPLKLWQIICEKEEE